MAQYAALVGKPATDPAVPPAGRTIRRIRPGDQVTMDFVATRLDVDISAEGVKSPASAAAEPGRAILSGAPRGRERKTVPARFFLGSTSL